MKAVVEYLILLPKADSFCDSVDGFTRLLQVDSDIKMKGGGVIDYQRDVFCCGYEITGGEVSGKDQRFFHLRFSLESTSSITQSKLDRFAAFLKTVRGIIAKAGGQAETLRDDISFYYSKKAYALVHEIENLMRKLIANFMLITVGKEWITETSPSEVQAAINRSKRKDYLNVLHTIDFKDLVDFLIHPYSKKSPHDLHTKLKGAHKLEEFKALKSFIPESNWTRYFANLVACDDAYLSKRWAELYDLRCKVAHNALVTKLDYERITELVEELRGKLQDAINKLPQVSVPKDELELVGENAARTVSALYGDYITAWTLLERNLINRCDELGYTGPAHAFKRASELIDLLRKGGRIKAEEAVHLNELREVRNRIVHDATASFTEAELKMHLSAVKDLTRNLGANSEYRRTESG
jgi:hypothetical protein